MTTHTTEVTPQCGLFVGTVDRGGEVATNSPVNLTMPGDPLLAGLPNPLLLGAGSEFFPQLLSDYDTAKWTVVATYRGWNVENNPAILHACYGPGQVVVGAFDYADVLPGNPTATAMLNNFATASVGCVPAIAGSRADAVRVGAGGVGVAAGAGAASAPRSAAAASPRLGFAAPKQAPRGLFRIGAPRVDANPCAGGSPARPPARPTRRSAAPAPARRRRAAGGRACRRAVRGRRPIQPMCRGRLCGASWLRTYARSAASDGGAPSATSAAATLWPQTSSGTPNTPAVGDAGEGLERALDSRRDRRSRRR